MKALTRVLLLLCALHCLLVLTACSDGESGRPPLPSGNGRSDGGGMEDMGAPPADDMEMPPQDMRMSPDDMAMPSEDMMMAGDDGGADMRPPMPCGGACRGATPVCNVARDTCVACLGDGDCMGDTVCDRTTNTCVGCTGDSDCPGGVCDEGTSTCVECTEASDCPALPQTIATCTGGLTCTYACETGWAVSPDGQDVMVDGCACELSYEGATANDSICDGLDNDCDGDVDEDVVLVQEGVSLPKGSMDCTVGLGVCERTGVVACDGSGGVTCDGMRGVPDPLQAGGETICDGLDNDCDGVLDEGCDDDGDGWCDKNFTAMSPPMSACAEGPGDCDDQNMDIYPGSAVGGCDGLDNDCDGQVDDVSPMTAAADNPVVTLQDFWASGSVAANDTSSILAAPAPTGFCVMNVEQGEFFAGDAGTPASAISGSVHMGTVTPGGVATTDYGVIPAQNTDGVTSVGTGLAPRLQALSWVDGRCVGLFIADEEYSVGGVTTQQRHLFLAHFDPAAAPGSMTNVVGVQELKADYSHIMPTAALSYDVTPSAQQVTVFYTDERRDAASNTDETALFYRAVDLTGPGALVPTAEARLQSTGFKTVRAATHDVSGGADEQYVLSGGQGAATTRGQVYAFTGGALVERGNPLPATTDGSISAVGLSLLNGLVHVGISNSALGYLYYHAFDRNLAAGVPVPHHYSIKVLSVLPEFFPGTWFAPTPRLIWALDPVREGVFTFESRNRTAHTTRLHPAIAPGEQVLGVGAFGDRTSVMTLVDRGTMAGGNARVGLRSYTCY